MSVRTLTVPELLAAFSDPSPTPGGGSASALAVSLGLALLTMVARMGRTREGTEADRRALDAAAEALTEMRERATGFIDEDASAYDSVVAAYRMPKGSPEEQDQRRVAIQKALRVAAEVPLNAMRLCQAGLTAGMDVARRGNPAAASDVGVAFELLTAGLRGAALNVRANLASLADAAQAEAFRQELSRLERSSAELVEQGRALIASAGQA